MLADFALDDVCVGGKDWVCIGDIVEILKYVNTRQREGVKATPRCADYMTRKQNDVVIAPRGNTKKI